MWLLIYWSLDIYIVIHFRAHEIISKIINHSDKISSDDHMIMIKRFFFESDSLAEEEVNLLQL